MIRGIQDERNLVRLFYKRGFAVMRAPASGGSTKMPRPDILAGSRDRGVQLAVEVKTTRKKTLYIPRESVRQLVEFSERFGCRPVIAVKFRGMKRRWRFLDPKDLDSTQSENFKITFEESLLRGMDLGEVMKEGRQTRLE